MGLIDLMWCRFKSLSLEERVLCLTTIDREICDIIIKDFCEKQKPDYISLKTFD